MFTVYNWQVAWNPYPELETDLRSIGLVKVGAWPDENGWSDKYEFTDGCCMLDWKRENRALQMFVVFHTLIVRDGIDPQKAHREFLKIDEYRRRISVDIDGATGSDWISAKD